MPEQLTPEITARKLLVDRLKDGAVGILADLGGQESRIRYGLIPDAGAVEGGSPESPMFLFGMIPGGQTWQVSGTPRAGRVTFLCQAVARGGSPTQAFGSISSVSTLSEKAQAALQGHRADDGDWSVMFSVIGPFDDVYSIDNEIFQAVGFYLDAWIGREQE